jgi:multiple sugar transport system substrate-binding protein
MKKVVRILGSLLVFAMLFTGCTPSSTSTVQSTAQKVKIQLMGPWVVESPEDEVLKGVVKSFMDANKDIDVELIGCPSADLVKKVQAMATSKSLPDLILTNGANIASWNDMGIVENLSKHFDASYLKGIYPQMLAEFNVNNQNYGIPLAAAPFVLILRKDLMDQAGIPIPKSYEDMLLTAKKLTVDTNNDGKIDRYGFGLMGFPDANTASRFILNLFAAGAPDIYKDASGKWATKINSPEGVNAFKFYYDLLNNKSVPPGAPEVDYTALLNLMATDKVAMAISGPHTIGAIYRQNPNMVGKLIAVPFTGKNTVAWLNTWGVVMSSSSTNKVAAAKFMKFSADNFIEMSKVTKRLTTRIDSAETVKKAVPEIAAILSCADYAINMAPVTFRGDVNNAIARGVNSMLAGTTKTPEEAAKETGKAVQDIIDKNK